MQYYIKIFLIVLILCLNTNVYAQASSDMVKFSPDYIRRLRVCGPHQESIFYNIDADETTYHIKATETIIGIRDGKCRTKTVLVLKDFDVTAGKIECAYNEQQRKTIADKITEAQNNPKKFPELQKLLNYYRKQRPDVCKPTNYFAEED